MVEAATRPVWSGPGRQAHILLPGLGEGEEGGVDDVVDGQVCELYHKIIPGHPTND